MREVALSNLTTGNKHYALSVLQSNNMVFAFTAPYSNPDLEGSTFPHPAFDQEVAHDFGRKHGFAVRAVGIRVTDAAAAYEACIANGGVGVLPPTTLVDQASGKELVVSEIKSVDDVVFRWVSGSFDGPFLPNCTPVNSPDINYGLDRVDHIVTNVPNLFEAVDYVMGSTGFHEFAEFTAEDVGTVDSGLNSMVNHHPFPSNTTLRQVLANNSESVLMPFNEPTFGTKRKSQIQTYLEHNNGSGVQHIALKTDNIFATMKELRQRTFCGGFDFMPAPGQDYYDKVPERIGENTLTADQFKELQALGLLADRDDQGVLLQVI
jgi:4-hydroxyphenylpyruvate dioxygenase